MSITFYGIVVVIHILAAIIGLGSTFALPFIMSGAKTTTTAVYAHRVNAKVEKLAKIGSLSLLATGLVLGFIHPSLFTEIWYVASIILYISLQPIVAYLIPKKTQVQIELLASSGGEELTEDYHALSKKIGRYNTIAMVAVVVLVLLMSLKPF